MRIAQIAPLYERVPPKFYGGTERIVSYLTEELVAQGHEVTLFASGDSVTRAHLVPCCDVALRLNPAVRDPLPYHMMMLEQVRRCAGEFDVLHFHIDILHCPVACQLVDQAVTTLHGRLDLPDLVPFYRMFPELPLVSISHDQRRPMPPVNWIDTVYHGLPRDLLPLSPDAQGGYVAFLGRVSPEKRPDLAIEIAVRSGMPLKIAAKVDNVDEDYWHGFIEPMVRQHSAIEFIGEISEGEKAEFLGSAAALLFPIDWPEPFGLAMIEAMACGTPVIAFRRGSVPEIVDSGVTGFIVNDVDEAVHAVEALHTIDRAGVRRRFEERFAVERMTHDYVAVYESLVGPRAQSAMLRRMKTHGIPLDAVA